MPWSSPHRTILFHWAVVITLAVVFAACSPPKTATIRKTAQLEARETAVAAAAETRLETALAALPEAARSASRKRIVANRMRFLALIEAVERERISDPMLLARVDKERSLPTDYEPADLAGLDEKDLTVSRKGHRLRKTVLEALLVMDESARRAGITLLVSSTYRSFSYQAEVFARNAQGLSAAEVALVSAQPGHSQHQLGTAIDFGSISDSFAATKAGIWLAENAGRFGFSLSYPKDMATVTGYSWESWHYRYIGQAAGALEAEFFDAVQQYLMLFLEAWRS
jgi:D-alanyl-D-alanine carboxypeptidase